MTPGRADLRGALAASTLILALARWQGAHAQAWVPERGHGTVSAAVQQLYVEWHTTSDGTKAKPGTMHLRALFLDADYGITDKLAVNVGIMYRHNRFVGSGGHDPGQLDHDHGESFMDDGRFHGGWGDWRVGLRYQWRTEPWAITPFVSYGAPSHDYTTFSHAAFGTGQERVEVGLNVGRRFAPPAQDLYFQGRYAYAWMEKVDVRRVNHSTLDLELGYFMTPRLTARALVTAQITHDGYDFPEDFPSRRDDRFFHHDQTIDNDYVNVGAGIGYLLNDDYALSVNLGRSVWGENAHLIDYAITVGISRGF